MIDLGPTICRRIGVRYVRITLLKLNTLPEVAVTLKKKKKKKQTLFTSFYSES